MFYPDGPGRILLARRATFEVWRSHGALPSNHSTCMGESRAKRNSFVSEFLQIPEILVKFWSPVIGWIIRSGGAGKGTPGWAADRDSICQNVE